MYTIDDLLDLEHTIAKPLFEGKTYGFEVLDLIEDFILEYGKTLSSDEYYSPKEGVWIAFDAEISPTACIVGPCIIGHKTEVRNSAFVRGAVIAGDNCVIGNSTEVKNSILFDNTQVPHFNYVGDSILGYCTHMGAGAVTSNFKANKKPVVLKNDKEEVLTNRLKVGAVLGDFADIGCNCVLNPGTIIGRNTQIYPLSCVRGQIKQNSIYKKEGLIVEKN